MNVVDPIQGSKKSGVTKNQKPISEAASEGVTEAEFDRQNQNNQVSSENNMSATFPGDFESKLSSASSEMSESKQLDELLVDYLELMETYVRTTLDEENLLRDGFINLAHARMCLKPHLITLSGFPNDNSPNLSASSTTVASPVKELSDDEDTHLHRQLHVDPSKEKGTQLRKIFGQMTPGSLKTAQRSFLRVLERSVERANVMNRLKYLETKILEITSRRDSSSNQRGSDSAQLKSKSTSQDKENRVENFDIVNMQKLKI